jgi:hypothetical protein
MAGVIEMALAANQSSYPFLELIWTMFVLFGFVLWFWLLIVVFGDLFRRHDMSGWAKAAWTIFVIVLPYIGILAYLIAQGGSMAARRGKETAAARDAYETDVRSIAGSAGQPADQIATAKQLRDSGDITADEYEVLKRKALASPSATGGDAPTATGSLR